jgi:hypothetical protein
MSGCAGSRRSAGAAGRRGCEAQAQALRQTLLSILSATEDPGKPWPRGTCDLLAANVASLRDGAGELAGAEALQLAWGAVCLLFVRAASHPRLICACWPPDAGGAGPGCSGRALLAGGGRAQAARACPMRCAESPLRPAARPQDAAQAASASADPAQAGHAAFLLSQARCAAPPPAPLATPPALLLP